MRKLNAFVFLSLNSFYKDEEDGISWHKHGVEEMNFSRENLQQKNILLFGRKTYEHMAAFWPTPMGQSLDPVIADGMNNAEKIVFSRTLKKPSWNNSRIIHENISEEIRILKATEGKDLTLLGSGNILSQFIENNILDGLEIMIDPVILPRGVPLFQNIEREHGLKLIGTKTFRSGVVLVRYQSEIS